MKMLHIRGEMYANVYFNGVPAGAEAFLHKLLTAVRDALESNKLRSNNPFVKFIESRGTDYDAYLSLTGDAFWALIDELAMMDINGLSEIARKYQNIGANFSAAEVYKGDAEDAPDESEIKAAKEETESAGGIFKDVTMPLYDSNKPEVYCMLSDHGQPVKFSEAYPEFANRKIRIISKFFMENDR